MLGQPASSQTVCRPSRRTSDFSSVYSGPVRSRVLIHSGLRSIGTWLLRTSMRSSLRPAGPTLVPAAGVGAAGSLMIPTVPRTHDRPGRANSSRGGRGGAPGSGGVLRVERLLPPVGQRGAALAHRRVRGVGGVGGRVLAAGPLG